MTSGTERGRRGTFARTVVASSTAGSRAAGGLGIGVMTVLYYLIVEYARPQDSIPLLPYLKVGLWAVLLGVLFLYAHRRHPFPRETRWFIAFLALLALSVPFAL